MKKPFRRAFIEITNACSLDCPFCAHSSRPETLMSPALFRSAAAQAGELAEVISLHVLGEPLTHPAFGEIISDCSRLGLRVNLVTNGILLGRFREQLYSEKCLAQISVSLHALSCLPEAPRRAALEEMISFARSKPAGLIVGFRLRAEKRDAFFEETLSAVTAAFKAQPGDFVRLADKVFLNFGGIFAWPGGAGGAGKKTCLGLRHHFGVLSDGRVVPCCADYDGALALGNIKERGLSEILNGQAARSLRDSLSGKSPMPAYCASCGFSAPDI